MIVRYDNDQSPSPLDRLLALADVYELTPAALLAAIDRAEAAAIASLAALLHAGDAGL
jgi:hypothetical protein